MINISKATLDPILIYPFLHRPSRTLLYTFQALSHHIPRQAAFSQRDKRLPVVAELEDVILKDIFYHVTCLSIPSSPVLA
jgi:hypothetical protein